MVSRCCCPPESLVPRLSQPVLDLVPQRRLAQAALHQRVQLALVRMPPARGANATLS
jgi:hypothetical protein